MGREGQGPKRKGGLEGRSVGVANVESRWNLASLEMGPGNRRNSVVPGERRQDREGAGPRRVGAPA